MEPKESKHLNPRAIFSKTGKGVHEASGKTSHLSRADRAVLAAIDGKTPLSDISAKFEKLSADKFDALIQLLDKDGFVREVSSGQSAAPTTRPAAPAAKAPPKAPPPSDDGDDMDFTQAIKVPKSLASAPPKGPAPAAPKPPQVDLAATARAGAERKAEEDLTLNFRAREELQAKMKAELEAKAKADARARAEANAAAEAKAASEAKSRAEAEARARAEAEAKTRAEADAKVKAAREAAVRMATEVKAKAEAEGKAKADAAEREKERIEAELNAKLDAERKARKDLEEKAKRDAEEMRQRLEAEMKAKLDAERKVREEEDRKRREEEDRKRKEEDERRAKEDAERRAREEADRKLRAEEDRKRKEEDERRRKEEDERRAKEEGERKAREEADRKMRAEDDRKRKEEAEKRSREEAERKKRDEEERKQREEDDRRRKEEDARRAKEEAERKARDAAEANARAAASASLPAIEPVVAPPPPPPSPPPAAAAPPASDLGDLLGDLDNFGKQEEEERKAKEEAERQAKEAAARNAKEAAERKAREEAEAKRREEEERRRKAEEEQRAQEEAERKAREDEERRKHEEAERKQEEAERKRKAKEALAANLGAAKGGDDVDVKEDDADMDDIKRDQKALAKRAAAREQPLSAIVASSGRPKRWGKPAAIAGLGLLVVGIGALHVVPMSTSDYEKGASEALGVPVKIGSARLSLITGVELKFENVAIGDSARIRVVRGVPDIGSLFGARKAFSRVELEGVSMGQSQIADALLGKAAGANFRVGRVMAKQLSLEGPVKLPPLDMDAALAGDGSVQSVSLTGSDKLLVQLSPKGSEIAFEISAASLAMPFVPALTLADFGMKGTANRSGVTSASFDGRAYDGVISGTARIQWGAKWSMEGDVRARTVKVAVFAPALISQGKVEGEGKFAMSGADAAKLYEGARLEGNFKIENGVMGKFNLRRALETGGAQTGGRTEFAEMTGQGVYERGTVQLRNLAFSSGAMNANASIDVDANGGISGRISADVKTPNQTLRAILNVSGKVQDPVIRK